MKEQELEMKQGYRFDPKEVEVSEERLKERVGDII